MLMKLWKDYRKLLIVIPIICFVFLFKINNVSALVYKNSFYSSYNNITNSSGILNNGGSVKATWGLNNYAFDNTYDLLVFKLGTFSIQTTTDNYGAYCMSWLPNSVNENSSAYQCGSYIGNEGHSFIEEGNVYIAVALHYGVDGVSDQYVPCTLNSELENMWVCPLNSSLGQPNRFDFEIKNGGYKSVKYNLTLNGMKYYYNYESTEIVNGLTGVQQAQVQTATYIQNFNNYVANTDTTSSENNSTTALSGLASDFNTNLGEMNQLTQFVFLPINFIISMLDSTCQPLVWDIPFVNTRVVVPCLSTIYNGYFAGFMGVFGIVMTSLLTYRSCIKLFGAIKGLLDAEDDKIEVVDL